MGEKPRDSASEIARFEMAAYSLLLEAVRLEASKGSIMEEYNWRMYEAAKKNMKEILNGA